MRCGGGREGAGWADRGGGVGKTLTGRSTAKCHSTMLFARITAQPAKSKKKNT